VFVDDQDCQAFVTTLGEAAVKAGWKVHAYCLLPDHFHLVIETPQPTLVAGMKWLLGTFTNRTNRRHRTHGHLFAGRYRGLPVAPEGGYLREACAQVLLKPARTGALAADQLLPAYPWSSLPASLLDPAGRPGWLELAPVLAAFGMGEDTVASRHRWLEELQSRRLFPDPEVWHRLDRGWYFGDPEFAASLLRRLHAGSDTVRHGVASRPAQALLGRQIIAEELASRGWTDAELGRRPRTDPVKVAIAQRVRRETALSLRWLAGELRAGSHTTLRNALAATARSPDLRASADPANPAARPRRTTPAARPHPAAETAAAPGKALPLATATFSVAWD
jgi:REP element-mobilizing transposase RayT